MTIEIQPIAYLSFIVFI